MVKCWWVIAVVCFGHLPIVAVTPDAGTVREKKAITVCRDAMTVTSHAEEYEEYTIILLYIKYKHQAVESS